MPQRLRVSCSVFLLTSMPSTTIRPVKRTAFMIESISVVLPAPLGPISPTRSDGPAFKRHAAERGHVVGVAHVNVVDLEQNRVVGCVMSEPLRIGPAAGQQVCGHRMRNTASAAVKRS